MKPTPKKQTGFTLIEIVIVLAIAALIMVIVFLAVAGAQRAQRDNTNKAAAGQALSQAEQYLANSSGTYSAAVPSNYLSGIKTSTGDNPTSSFQTAKTPLVAGQVVVVTYAQCTTDSKTGAVSVTKGNASQAAALWYSEGSGSTQCIGN